MQIGDKVSCQIDFGKCDPVTKTGRVVYLHPQHRFYIAEFEGLGGLWRESFFFPPPKPKPRAKYTTDEQVARYGELVEQGKPRCEIMKIMNTTETRIVALRKKWRQLHDSVRA